jgi:polyphosphate kinase 2 (PPK2 family)
MYGYRASAKRYLLWVLQALDMAGVERTTDMVLQHFDPAVRRSCRLRRPGATVDVSGCGSRAHAG